MNSGLLQISKQKCHDGHIMTFSHNHAEQLMKFSVFQPSKIQSALVFLAGLTCTNETFLTKGCATADASRLGTFLICPDTSPRDLQIEGDEDSWDFGTGAGFYINATVAKWSQYQMFTYVEDLVKLCIKEFNLDPSKIGITGHSMGTLYLIVGGHGALILSLKTNLFKTCSAFAPIANPSECAWGIKAFSGYLGSDRDSWKCWDASELVKTYDGDSLHILIDQGLLAATQNKALRIST